LRKYNPDEPRVPAGNPDGGQWTDGGDGGASAGALGDVAPGALASPLIDPVASTPDVPIHDAAFRLPRQGPDAEEDVAAAVQDTGYNLAPEMQAVARDLYRLFMENGGDTGALQSYLKERGLVVSELPDVLRSLFDPPRPLAALQTQNPPRGFLTEGALLSCLGPTIPGYEWHHIIEQSGQTRPDLTSDEGIQTWIQNTDNMVQVPVIKHFCVSGIMSSSVSPGVRLRDVVREHDPLAQRAAGIRLLRICRVIP
jgi:hypothetical protein